MTKVGAGRMAPGKLSPHSLASTLISLAALAVGLFIAAHHPLSPTAMMAGCLVALIICTRFDHAWLLLLPALLPIVDLAPWTGWLSFEEFDILVLGAAAGAWLRHGWKPGASAPSRPSATLLILVAIYLLALAIAFARGIADAGGFEFGWFQGYEGPMNSVRLAKSFVLAALFAPLLGRVNSRLDGRGVTYLGWGMALGLATVSLAALWERIAFPGLLNFSADYRTTALFWEMHVGGAALEDFLALTLPFAVFLLLQSKRIGQFLPASIALAMGVYASLTTFSRGAYLAITMSLVTMALLLIGRGLRDNPASSGPSRTKIALLGILAALAIAGLSFLVFRQGGYRAMLAVLGCLTTIMLTMDQARAASAKQWAVTFALAIPLVLVAFALTWLFGKGAYWSYVTLFVLALAGWLSGLRTPSNVSQSLALSSTLALPFSAALIANHWGGTPALGDSSIVLMIIFLMFAWGTGTKHPVWPSGWRRQGIVLAGTLSIATMVAVFSGGAYISGRFSASGGDFLMRLHHWQAALKLLKTPNDWLFGKGLGRFPPSFFFGAPGNEYPGSYKINQESQNSFISLSGPRYQAGYGEVLRIGQRVVPVSAGRYKLEFDVRTDSKINLSFTICAKHLLYAEGCAGREIAVPVTNSKWQHQTIEFDRRQFSGGGWYAPQLNFFSLAIETMGNRADLDNLVLTDPLGHSMLDNGDFSNDMEHWFFTSDHLHVPWHMENLFLHVLFEQGIIGLTAFAMLIVAALLRLLVGHRSYHPLAPAMVAGIVGFLVDGLFDSLLDVPRVAFLFFLLLLLSIQGRKPT
jgi:hypothetical protein